MQSPIMVKIIRLIDEADDIKTIMFNHRFTEDPEPGQFLMAWVPGVDEIPLAFSYIVTKKQREYGVTIAKVGSATEHFHSLKEGDNFGIRGPYGSGFDFGSAKKILAVGGGIGMAPLAPAVEAARTGRRNVRVIVGAKTEIGVFVQSKST